MARTSRRAPRRPERAPRRTAARPALEPDDGGAGRPDGVAAARLGRAVDRAEGGPAGGARASLARSAPLWIVELAADQPEARKDPGPRGWPGAEVDEDRAEQPAEGV